MCSFISKLVSCLVPTQSDAAPQSASEAGRLLSRQDVLDALLKQFKEQLSLETTKVSMLFHTSFIIYLNQSDYDRISPAFQITVNDAVTIFLREIEKRLSDYPDYRPHAKYWVFQLVGIPEGSAIDGVPDEDLESGMVIIRSSIYATDDYSSTTDSGGGRIVTTMHTVNSMKAMPSAMNLAALPGLIQLDKDKYRIRFDPKGILGFDTDNSVPLPEERPAANRKSARITADDGQFILNGRTFTSYQMSGNMLRISGRNEITQPNVETLCIDSDEILNPHVIIKYDSSTGMYQMNAFGPTKLNEITVNTGMFDNWTTLPNNSVIMLNDEIQLSFKII